MDRVVEKLVALGVPGLVLLVAIATSGLAGGAAIVSALAMLGGPFGMLGGIAVLAILPLVSQAIAKYGTEALAIKVVKGLQEKGETKVAILRKLKMYPISRELRKKIEGYLDRSG